MNAQEEHSVDASSPSQTPDADAKGAAPSESAGVSLGVAVFISVVASVLSVGAYHLAIAPHLTRIAVVDLPAIYREREAAFEHALTREGATNSERDAAMASAREFARQLPRALDELADECACTLLAANAVAGRYHAADLTQTLRGKISP